MRIELKGRGDAHADEALLSRVEKKLGKVARQVSPLAELHIELREEFGEQVAEGAELLVFEAEGGKKSA